MRQKKKEGKLHIGWLNGPRKFLKRGLALGLIATCLVTAFWYDGLQADAVFDESQAVTFRNYTSIHVIEESVLFIGTWLIHTQALTDELYEKATASAADSNQTSIYYKSELAGGIWVDITNASGLGELTGEGEIVDESQLADLWVTSYTGSDGITRSAVTDAAINIFDTPDPYDIYNLPEMESIRLQFDNVFSKDKTGVDKYYYDILNAFFEYEQGLASDGARRFERLRSDVTDTLDRQLAALQVCYEQLQIRQETESAEIVHKLMGKLDASRRAEVFEKLCQIEGNELELLQSKASGEGYSAGSYKDKDFVENTNVSEAIGTAIESAQESYITYSGKMLMDGNTIIGEEEYRLSSQIVSQAENGFSPRLESLLHQLNALYHIQEGVVADVEEELAVAEGLGNDAQDAYKELLWSGTGLQYQSVVSKGASLSAQNQALEDQKTSAEDARMQLQFLVEAMTMRMGAEESVEYVYQLVDEANGWYGRISKDAFRDKASGSLDAYLLWLQELAKEIMSENEMLASELDRLEKEKEELLEAQEGALDENDLALAKKYDALIDALDQEIERASKELNDLIYDPASSAADKARAENQAGSATALNNINQLKNSALSMLASGSSDIGNFLDALAALGAEDALKEIGDKAGDNLQDAIADAIQDSQASSMHDLYQDGGLSADTEALMNQIEDFFGASFDNLPKGSQAVVLYALAQLDMDGNAAAGDLAVVYAGQCAQDKNDYLYQRLNNSNEVYVPVKSVGKCLGYRYLYDDTRCEATLSGGARVYLLSAGSNLMYLRMADSRKTGSYHENPVELKESVKLKEIPYMIEEDAEEQFQCYAIYIQDTEYGVCLGRKLYLQAEELIEAFHEGN